ncbi:hypothetical protein [Pseudomonas saudiphocaensis]|uniref:hypothetical protein n=1 Tax=Pseudomonas saudiphocaensis TaxID=1499686 RepID=UPI000F781DFF|nr:hypothetical protein [Pseudomonas saudiphocaensis]RRV13665.1 hypothetical protein EGJ00_15040 [Pseudomonas saudiphocaensis]
MAGTESDNGEHSTAPGDPAADDPLSRMRWRFFGSLVLIGLLVGMMIGRLTTPEPARLIDVQAVEEGLALRFNQQTAYREELIDGAYALLLQARGSEGAGQLRFNGENIRWRVQPAEHGLTLHLVALRTLRVQATEREVGGDWLLELRPAVD